MQTVLNQPERVLDIMRDVAAAEILPRFKTLEAHEITEKKPGDLVTIADKESERALSEHLRKLLPGSAVVGEEGFEADPDTLNLLGAPEPVWVLDPVDGTHNFAHGKSPFTVIVALVERSQIVAGWIIDPVAGDAVWAISGHGAWQQDKSGTASRIERKKHGTAKPFEAGVMTCGPKLQRRLERAANELSMPLPKIINRYRCAGREYMDVITGTIDYTRYAGLLKPWDHAAGSMIVREAGGRADQVADGAPYRISTSLGTQSLGVTGKHDAWPQLRELLKRADELTG